MALGREQVVQTAEKLVARGKIEAAIREYRKVLSEQPNDPTTLNRVGDLYARIDRPEEAVRLFTQIAEVYTKDGFFVKAIAIYKKIIKLDPIRLEVYERLAELYHRQGLVNEARTQYQVLADYYVKHGNSGSALSIYERLAKLEPDNPSPRVKLAELYQEQHLTDKAMGEYLAIATLMISHRRPEQAVQVYERALDVDSENLAFIADGVAALRRAGHTGAAAKLLASAAKRNPAAKMLARLAPPPEPEVEESTAEVMPSSASPPEIAPPAEPVALPPPVEVDRAAAGFDLDADELEDLSGPAAVRTAGAVEEEIELDLEDVFVLDFDADETPASLVIPPADMIAESPAGDEVGEFTFEPPPELDELGFGLEEPAPAPGEIAEIGEIDADFLEQTAAELQPRRHRHAEDLFAEAEVLAKYSLDDKAVERLLDVLKLEPRHLDAMALLIRIDLDKGRFARVASVARDLAPAAAERGHPEAWQGVRPRLLAAGFKLDGDAVVEVPSPRPDQSEVKIGRLIEDLLGDVRPAAHKPRPAAPAGDRFDAAFAEIASESPTAKRKRKLEPSAPPPPAAAEEGTLAPSVDAVAAPAPPPPPAPPSTAPATVATAAGGALEDGGVDWLDDVVQPVPGVAPLPAEEVFAEEAFFDLAAELEQELSAEGQIAFGPDELTAPSEQTLEEIVEGFKRGVAESLSPEDYDTHFNLGIAYREMGLLDEAIGEFQLAAKAPDRLIECCSMLGLCFQDKGLPELAVKWYRRGLAAPGLTEDDSQGLLYDLGNVYLATGDLTSAYQTFVDVYGTNSNYRDVVAKLEEISSRGN